jgi:hypothetical protein
MQWYCRMVLCEDTSACFLMQVDAILSHGLSNVLIYPNPTNGQLFLQFESTQAGRLVKVKNVLGQELKIIEAEGVFTEIFLEGANGVYLLELLEGQEQIGITKVIKR